VISLPTQGKLKVVVIDRIAGTIRAGLGKIGLALIGGLSPVHKPVVRTRERLNLSAIGLVGWLQK
jgi:hypothetical protein